MTTRLNGIIFKQGMFGTPRTYTLELKNDTLFVLNTGYARMYTEPRASLMPIRFVLEKLAFALIRPIMKRLVTHFEGKDKITIGAAEDAITQMGADSYLSQNKHSFSIHKSQILEAETAVFDYDSTFGSELQINLIGKHKERSYPALLLNVNDELMVFASKENTLEEVEQFKEAIITMLT